MITISQQFSQRAGEAVAAGKGVEVSVSQAFSRGQREKVYSSVILQHLMRVLEKGSGRCLGASSSK